MNNVKKRMGMYKEKSTYTLKKSERLVELIENSKDIRKDSSLSDCRKFVKHASELDARDLSAVGVEKLYNALQIDCSINILHNDSENRIMSDEVYDKVVGLKKEFEEKGYSELLKYTSGYFKDTRVGVFNVYESDEDYLEEQLESIDDCVKAGSLKFLAGVKPGTRAVELSEDSLHNRPQNDDLYDALQYEKINGGK